MRSLIYLGYFILKTNYRDLIKSFKCAREKKYNVVRLVSDMVYCSVRYGSSFVDYFNFQFYRKNHSQRKAYATMGFMYRFHKNLNSQQKIVEVDSKERFSHNFKQYCNNSYLFQEHEKENLITLLSSRIGKKIVLKDPESTAGKSIRIIQVATENNNLQIGNKSIEQFIKAEFSKTSSIYFEDYIVQHDSINLISPTGVNTIRIITLVNNNKIVEIIGSVFRISVDSPIDNFSAGNLAAEINPKTGIVTTGGIRKRSTCDIYHEYHPSTGKKIKGFQIPFWEEIVSMIKMAALVVPEVRSIGWDIAITNEGPILIEGNSQWNKDTWQIPAGYGKKHIIEEIIKQ